MVTLSLLLFALFFTPAQEQVSPPVEVLDVEVLVRELKPHLGPDQIDPPPPGLVTSDTVRGKPKEWDRKGEQPTIESRSRELRNVATRPVREAAVRRSSTLYRYEYQVRVKNIGPKKIKSILWEYQLRDASDTTIASRLFLCAVSVKSGADKVLKASTFSAPNRVVSADDKSQKQKAVVNRVEFTDGSTWVNNEWKQDSDVVMNVQGGQCREYR